MRSKAVAALIFVTIVFQHFQLLKIGTYSLTLGLLTGAVAILLASRTLPLIRITLVWALIVSLSSLAAMFAPDIQLSWKFLTNLLMFLLSSLFVVTASGGLRDESVDQGRFWLAIRLALGTVVLLSVAQTITGSMGSLVLFNPFGDFQFQHRYNPHLEFNPVPRAHGFFLEPSYDAFVIGALSVALLCRGAYFRSTMVLALIGMASCQSATGLILILGIAMLIAVKSSPKVAVPIAFGGAVLLVYFGDYLRSRVESIADVGSSGNYRLIAPLQVIGDVLTTHPLGMPLGSIYDVIPTYGLVMDGVEQTISLDNGVYVVIYYFGWFGMLMLGLLFAWACHSLFRRSPSMTDRRYDWVVPVWLVGSLLFSGGIMAPEFGIMTWLTVISFVESRRKKGDLFGADEAVAKRGYRHVPRY